MMGDGKALQSGTSHYLGQNFAQAFDVKYLDQTGQQQHCWTTSWGLSTRFIGAIIMVHGDDQGLVLPPRLAPHQAVIVPIFKNEEEKAAVLGAAKELKVQLAKAGIRVVLDEREGQSPGWKFNDWEMRGVPVRVELGPKDVAKQAAVVARRDRPGREGKISASLADLPSTVQKLLAEIQQALHDKALAFRRQNTRATSTYPEFKEAVESGFAFAGWCGRGECEEKIKEETRATMRCIPIDQDSVLGNGSGGVAGKCIYCGQESKERAIFARAY
jgi:prolyl-tRNA synthetase